MLGPVGFFIEIIEMDRDWSLIIMKEYKVQAAQQNCYNRVQLFSTIIGSKTFAHGDKFRNLNLGRRVGPMLKAGSLMRASDPAGPGGLPPPVHNRRVSKGDCRASTGFALAGTNARRCRLPVCPIDGPREPRVAETGVPAQLQILAVTLGRQQPGGAVPARAAGPAGLGTIESSAPVRAAAALRGGEAGPGLLRAAYVNRHPSTRAAAARAGRSGENGGLQCACRDGRTGNRAYGRPLPIPGPIRYWAGLAPVPGQVYNSRASCNRCPIQFLKAPGPASAMGTEKAQTGRSLQRPRIRVGRRTWPRRSLARCRLPRPTLSRSRSSR